MNRPIKFRAWDGEGMSVPFTFDDIVFDKFKADKGWSERVYPKMGEGNYKLMQLTSLLDKNGKEIYEGDVVDIDGAKAEVCFYNGAFCVKDYFVNHPYSYLSQFDESDVEIAGNVHENPELLSLNTA